MRKPPLKTIEDLKKERVESLMRSEKALAAHPEAYREIKTLVKDVVSKTVDIGDYFSIVSRLTHLLEAMTLSGSGSIFTYFFENIDPRQLGDVRYFRGVCLDLCEQLDELDDFRAKKRRLCIIK
ncbi:hypothetical protein ACFLZM_03660 [Thermodesulfobacteriota bacterium]